MRGTERSACRITRQGCRIPAPPQSPFKRTSSSLSREIGAAILRRVSSRRTFPFVRPSCPKPPYRALPSGGGMASDLPQTRVGADGSRMSVLMPDGVHVGEREPHVSLSWKTPVFPGFRGVRGSTPSGFNVGCVPIERRGDTMTRSVIDTKVLLLVLALPLFGGTAMGQVPAVPDLPAVYPAKDPGVRGGSPGAGGSIRGLNTDERAFFSAGQDEFEEVQSVQGDAIIPGTEPGLGPRFNLDSCAGCHAQPATGGTSPLPNPQVEVATKAGASNYVPFFVTSDGPVREARFKSKPNGARDGGVHALFTIRGRQDASGCDIFPPDFAAEAAANNLIFRIPTPVFGAGLIEAVPDAPIVGNKNSSLLRKRALGLAVREDRSGNDGTITRFRWKAQNMSLELFAGEAYNVVQGVTNELFPTERDETPTCLFNGIPEDHTNFTATTITDVPSDVVRFAVFMRFLAQPTPANGN